MSFFLCSSRPHHMPLRRRGGCGDDRAKDALRPATGGGLAMGAESEQRRLTGDCTSIYLLIYIVCVCLYNMYIGRKMRFDPLPGGGGGGGRHWSRERVTASHRCSHTCQYMHTYVCIYIVCVCLYNIYILGERCASPRYRGGARDGSRERATASHRFLHIYLSSYIYCVCMSI